MLCRQFHQHNYDVQWARSLSGAMRVCEPMQTISKVLFKYGMQESYIDAVRWIKTFHTFLKYFESKQRIDPDWRQTGLAVTATLPGAVRNGLQWPKN
jgi:hypothetical protein